MKFSITLVLVASGLSTLVFANPGADNYNNNLTLRDFDSDLLMDRNFHEFDLEDRDYSYDLEDRDFIYELEVREFDDLRTRDLELEERVFVKELEERELELEERNLGIQERDVPEGNKLEARIAPFETDIFGKLRKFIKVMKTGHA
ncbi:hypothetical protein BDQ12DRAFT_63684 [Crucibulum laeve]|uniref:Uncharacterized protein n=1 Tax=Crucibulum laeve TaxID=68775 RepID=A0A5C3MER6_9AGAR|nr:hypothetical protein BDQ12DRAFT_63684 [Crucibulum laeve]